MRGVKPDPTPSLQALYLIPDPAILVSYLIILRLAHSVTATLLSPFLKAQPHFRDFHHPLPPERCSETSAPQASPYSDTSLKVTSSKKPSLNTPFKEVTQSLSVPAP